MGKQEKAWYILLCKMTIKNVKNEYFVYITGSPCNARSTGKFVYYLSGWQMGVLWVGLGQSLNLCWAPKSRGCRRTNLHSGHPFVLDTVGITLVYGVKSLPVAVECSFWCVRQCHSLTKRAHGRREHFASQPFIADKQLGMKHLILSRIFFVASESL